MSEPTWLPNLVGGVSIWKLGVDLNEEKFMGGRLLVPETEGSESLPVTVRWDLTGLVPLSEAAAKHPDDVQNAMNDFRACLERVAKVFATPNSGFDKYKAAFTVPSIEAEGGANYFYSPEKKKLYVINWGASPRAMGGKSEFVFGYEDWGKVFTDKVPPPATESARMLAAGGTVGAAAAAEQKKEEEKKKKEEDKKKKDEDKKKRPWWLWPLFALIAIALVLLALVLLKQCEEPTTRGPDAAAEAGGDGGGDAMAEAGGDGAADAASATDATADAAGDGGDAGADAASADAGKDAGKDGGVASDDDDDDDDDDGSSGGASSSGGTGTSKVIVTVGGAGTGGAKGGPHRRHYQKAATKWRVATGNEKVSRTEQRGRRFDVWLAPGKTFEGVRVEWQGADGKWHPH